MIRNCDHVLTISYIICNSYLFNVLYCLPFIKILKSPSSLHGVFSNAHFVSMFNYLNILFNLTTYVKSGFQMLMTPSRKIFFCSIYVDKIRAEIRIVEIISCSFIHQLTHLANLAYLTRFYCACQHGTQRDNIGFQKFFPHCFSPTSLEQNVFSPGTCHFICTYLKPSIDICVI